MKKEFNGFTIEKQLPFNKLIVLCDKGHKKICDYSNFSTGRVSCLECKYDEYKKYIGTKNGSLTVNDIVLKKNSYIFKTICDCGSKKQLTISYINQKYCGKKCIYHKRKQKADHRRYIDGLYPKRTRIYIIYLGMTGRCNRETDSGYYGYGGRGIKCLWKDFDGFYKDMYESYEKHIKEFGEKQTTIDRIDVNGHYCKENCKWSTPKEQSNNKRNNILVGNTCLKHQCEIDGHNYGKISLRMKKGMSYSEAISH